MTDATDALARALDDHEVPTRSDKWIRHERGDCAAYCVPAILRALAALGYAVVPIAMLEEIDTYGIVDNALRRQVRAVIDSTAAEAADREAADRVASIASPVTSPSAAADPVTAPANSSSTRYELYGPRRYPEPGKEAGA